VNTIPTSTTQLTSFEAPSNVGDNYGQRIRGYICAPVSGNYTFYIASDDSGELWLSTSSDPAMRQKIASVSGWTNPREWTKYASQKSVTITLQANTKYYIEALMSEGTGGDNLAVGWLIPGSTVVDVIPGTSLSPFVVTDTTASTAIIAAPGYVMLPAKVEAEAYVNKSGMWLQATTDVGGGSNMAGINTGMWLDYNVSVASDATFTFNFRVASPNTGGAIEVRKADGTVLATITVPNTGAWQTWTTVSTSVNLPAGNQTLRLYVKSGGFNLNWWEALGANNLSRTSAKIESAVTEMTTVENRQGLNVYPNPFRSTATIEFAVPEGNSASVEIFTVQGVLVDVLFKAQKVSGTVNRVFINGSRYSSGIYICKLTYGDGKVLYKKIVLQK
jgi:hypothetical protein